MIQPVLEEAGFHCHRVVFAGDPTRAQLLATLNGQEAGRVLGFSGHTDVVPVGQVKWRTDPFQATETDGKLYGRGTADMKAGLVAQIAAATQIAKEKIPFKGQIKLLITAAEEVGLQGAGELTKAGYANDLDGLVIGEPTDLQIATAHKGVFWLQVKTFGQSSHSSRPHQGVNAIDHLILAIQAIQAELDLEANDPIVGPSTLSLNHIGGGNGNNVVPDHAEALFDIRTIASQDTQAIYNQAQTILDKLATQVEAFQYELTVEADVKAVSTPRDSDLVQATESALTTQQQPIDYSSFSGGTDASQFTQAGDFPIIIIGPGKMDMAHQPNEYVDLQDFYTMIQVYKDLALNFLNQ
ncbi:ArgE/DapE family deacylase [Hutsoniella sourekii]